MKSYNFIQELQEEGFDLKQIADFCVTEKHLQQWAFLIQALSKNVMI